MAGTWSLFSVSPWVSCTVAGSEQTHSTLQSSSWVKGWKKGAGGQGRWRSVLRGWLRGDQPCWGENLEVRSWIPEIEEVLLMASIKLIWDHCLPHPSQLISDPCKCTPPQTRAFLRRVIFRQWERSCHLFWTLKIIKLFSSIYTACLLPVFKNKCTILLE